MDQKQKVKGQEQSKVSHCGIDIYRQERIRKGSGIFYFVLWGRFGRINSCVRSVKFGKLNVVPIEPAVGCIIWCSRKELN